MGHDDYGLAIFVPKTEKELVELILGLRIKVSGRFIGKKDRRFIDKSPGYSYSLLLSS